MKQQFGILVRNFNLKKRYVEPIKPEFLNSLNKSFVFRKIKFDFSGGL